MIFLLLSNPSQTSRNDYGKNMKLKYLIKEDVSVIDIQNMKNIFRSEHWEAIMEKQAMIRRNRCLTEECEETAEIEDAATETTQTPLLDKKELGKTEFL